MMFGYVLLLAFLVILPLQGTANPTQQKTLQWPSTYHAKGTIILSYALVAEPFETWVNMTAGMSRLDTYNGMATVVNRGDESNFGVMYKIVYTSLKQPPEQTCFKVPGVEEASVTPQGILPNISLYQFLTTSGDRDIYQSRFTEGNKENTYTLLVNHTTGAPLTLSFKGYDRVLGSHYDVYIISYEAFEPTVEDSSVFDIPSKYDCGPFPGPGISDPMSENLFFEFVGAHGYTRSHQTSRVDSDFAKFKDKHRKVYKSLTEEEERKRNFRFNYRYINSMNRANKGFELAVNHLTDLSDGELKRMRGYYSSSPSVNTNCSKFQSQGLSVPLPSSVNWRLQGAVTRVKDQGVCGSCWSFGTTGTLEGSYFLKHKRLVEFSEQAFVDCSWKYGNNGCDGGESERAYNWAIDNQCIVPEYNYTNYKMEDGMCRVTSAMCLSKITECYNTMSGNITDLEIAVAAKGPISVAIDASHKSFTFYSHGVYYEPDCGNDPDSLDHQVLLVGYGTQDNQNYWLVKNSWSNYWGMDGYVLMSQRNNNCGVATDASFADVD